MIFAVGPFTARPPMMGDTATTGAAHSAIASRMETTTVIAALLVLCAVGLILYGMVALAEMMIMKKYGD